MDIKGFYLTTTISFFLQDDRDAFYVCDLGDVLKKHLRWVRAMPRITPFYAVKCNDSQTVVMTLAALGAGFDCASKVCLDDPWRYTVDIPLMCLFEPLRQHTQ